MSLDSVLKKLESRIEEFVEALVSIGEQEHGA